MNKRSSTCRCIFWVLLFLVVNINSDAQISNNLYLTPYLGQHFNNTSTSLFDNNGSYNNLYSYRNVGFAEGILFKGIFKQFRVSMGLIVSKQLNTKNKISLIYINNEDASIQWLMRINTNTPNYTTTTNGKPIMQDYTVGQLAGCSLNKFGLFSSYSLINTQNHNSNDQDKSGLNLSALIGFNYHFVSNSGTGKLRTQETLIEISPNILDTVSVTIYLTRLREINYAIPLGIDLDWFNKKGKNKLNIKLFYEHAFYESVSTQTIITLKNQMWEENSYARGGGWRFYIGYPISVKR